MNYLITFVASFLIWIMFAGLFVLWFIDGKIKKEQVLHALLAVGISWVATHILKDMFEVPRPFVLEGVRPLTLFVSSGEDWAFPSSHAAIAAAMATTVWLHDKKVGLIFISGALLVGAGRVMSLSHYPLDIAGGAFIGIVVALLIEKLHLFKITPK